MLKFRSFRQDSKGSVAVEFALVSTFFLFPLFSGVTDCIEIISGQAQLNTALQALYYNAWTNPTTAIAPASTSTSPSTMATPTEMQTVLSAIDASSMTNMTLGSVDGTPSYECYTPGNSTMTAYIPEDDSTTPSTPGHCPSTAPQQQTWVTYQINATVNLTFPFPGLPRAMPLTATGKVEVQ